MQKGHWQVWGYSPDGKPKLIDQFIHRNEAQHYCQRLKRLIGKSTPIVLCYNPIPNEP